MTASSTTPVAAAPSAPRAPRIRPAKIALHIVLALVAITMFAPFAWMVLTSLKALPQQLQEPLSIIPDPWTWSNWPDAWNALPFGRAYMNSIYITALTVVGSLFTCTLAAYGFARIPFRGSNAIFWVFLAMQMVPSQVTLVPFYFIMAKIGWVDSHLALIVPAVLINPFGVFLARQFILAVPVELEEAATVDGASRWRIYWQIILPAIRPGMGALGIIVALSAWNSFLLPLVLLNSTELFTVPLLLSQFQGQFGGMDYGIIMAATALSTLPMLVAFVFGQRQIINSLATSGLGGR
ncbi:carbohydrate ABC transporter permease [Brachybacterium hainanense]|uniref:Carbohydrate ABC transporter permease n=1 Tax=Brachybacterium hainanense TaxID=1541174 RepID=A0ABV6RCJ8_9MICO